MNKFIMSCLLVLIVIAQGSDYKKRIDIEKLNVTQLSVLASVEVYYKTWANGSCKEKAKVMKVIDKILNTLPGDKIAGEFKCCYEIEE